MRTSRTRLLLHADAAFGSGATSFSSGLETLAADGLVTDEAALTATMIDAVRLRWNTFDRVFLARSHAAEAGQRVALDREVETSMLGEAARDASRRAGLALLGTWERLGHLRAGEHRRAALRAPGAGHLSVAQGLVWAEELSLADAEAISCWSLLSTLASSAVRLSVAGHRAAQRALIDAERAVAPLLALPVDTSSVPYAFTPLQDIAVERHRLAETRLFAS